MPKTFACYCHGHYQPDELLEDRGPSSDQSRAPNRAKRLFAQWPRASLRMPEHIKQPRPLTVAPLLAIAAGMVAGLATLIVDTLLLRAAQGFWAMPSPSIAMVQLAIGIILGSLAATVGLVKQHTLGIEAAGLRPIVTFSGCALAIYLLPLWDHVDHVLNRNQQLVRSAISAALVLLLISAFAFVLARIGQAYDRGWLGAWIASLAVSALLIGNNTVLEKPLAWPSIRFDLGVGLVSVALVLLLRTRFKERRAADPALALVAGAIAVLCASLALVLVNEPQQDQAKPDPILVEQNKRPHVLLLVFDTMRFDVFHDVLVNTEEGRDFAQALGPIVWFDQATATGAATPPTMSSVLSGLYPPQHGVDGSARSNWMLNVHKDVPLLAGVLGDHGYQSLAFVTNRALYGSLALSRGIEWFKPIETVAHAFPLGSIPQLLFGTSAAPYAEADRARRTLTAGLGRRRDPSRPLFLWYHLFDTHSPLQPHPELPATPLDESLTDQQHLYRDSARFALKETAVALRELKQWLPPQNTLTFVIADHGEMLSADGNTAPGTEVDRGHGQGYFESIVHVPFGLQLPQTENLPLNHSTRSTTLISQVDLVPTVLDYLDITWSRKLPGCSLLPIARGETDDGTCRSFAISSANTGSPRHRSFRTPRLKVMVSPEDAFPPHLYELEHDPGERHNLASERPEALQAAVRLLDQFWLQFDTENKNKPVALDADTIETLKALGYLQ